MLQCKQYSTLRETLTLSLSCIDFNKLTDDKELFIFFMSGNKGDSGKVTKPVVDCK
jgi:hypothetical protein